MLNFNIKLGKKFDRSMFKKIDQIKKQIVTMNKTIDNNSVDTESIIILERSLTCKNK